MLRRSSRAACSFSILVVLLAAACGGGGDPPGDPDASAPPDAEVAPDAIPAEVCDNVFDDDHDGNVDCDDTDCYGTAVCDEILCHDTIDNDHDGAVDCDDPHCAKSPMCRPEAACTDGLDDDGDGAVDCQDSDCTEACIASCGDQDTPVVLTATGFPFAIPDEGTVEVPFASGGSGVITSAGVRFGATHLRDEDLDIALVAPGGAAIDLSSDNGGFVDNYIDTVFSDGADLSIVDGNAPFTGTYLPEEPFARLAGADVNGTWAVRVTDDLAGQTGQVEAAELILCVCDGGSGCEVGLACLNGGDDDGDALLDCDDPDCAGVLQCIHELDCDDGLDEEPDGLVDCADDDCAQVPYCLAEVDCGDGSDDDSDGFADCLDPGCDGIDGCELGAEASCSDGIDNDGDGAADCLDTECASELICAITCAPGELRRRHDSTDVPVSIVDNQTVTSDIDITDDGLVTNAAVRFHIDHTFDGDLDIFLLSPDSGQLELSSDNGGSGENYVDTLLIDTATAPVTDGAAPFTGSYLPEQPFSGLDGRSLDGTWTLQIADDAGGDTGSLLAWTLLTCACDPTGGECELGPIACRNGTDDDGDGVIDCDEPSCATDVTCTPETVCDDDLDQDLDGLIDCLDADCDGVAGCELGTEVTCDDQLDNDADGAVDCDDASCATDAYCVPEVDCTNGIDDDSDGLPDCLDPACDGVQGCQLGSEQSCDDGFDNDGDGSADCADSECTGQLICAIPTCPTGTTKTLYTATGLPQGVPDNGVGTGDYRVVSIPVASAGLVSVVAVRVDITHTWDSDLDIYLDAPGGTRELSTGNGGSSDNYTGTVFVDSAATAITSGNAPFTGRFQPEQPLSGLSGTASAGDWSLRVGDHATGDVGTITGYQLVTCACDATSGSCEFGPVACRNGADDDADGLVDCQEAACATDPFCIPEAVCDDGLDNDVDGAIDCADGNCHGVGRCEFGTEVSCTDAFDNDADGGTDCGDPDCAAAPACLVESDCDNGLDEDGDNLIDCDDTDCDADLGCITEVDCRDGLDNDGDGNVDCLDLGCDGVQGCEHGTEVSCDDGSDNDGDGAVDCVDTQCAPLLVCAITTCPTGTSKTIYTQTSGLPLAIPDSDVAVSTIAVPDAGLVAAVAIQLDVTHPNDADLDIYLATPGGVRELTTDNGGTGDHYTGTILIDTAATAITAGTAPFTGRFRPERSLGALSGTAHAGNWSLRVGDDLATNAGQLTSYSILTCSCDAGSAECEFGAFACGNGVDDDGDGLVDCVEAACATTASCVPASEHRCNDGVDDDGDSATDCDDTECAWACTALPSCPAGQLHVYAPFDLPQTIPTSAVTLGAQVSVPVGGTVADAAVRFSATHTWDSDISFGVFSPAGTFRDLTSGNGGSSDDYVSTVLVDSAATAITAGTAPFTGSFQPEQPFSALAGEQAYGPWQFQLQDTASGDGGSWTEASLALCVAP